MPGDYDVPDDWYSTEETLWEILVGADSELGNDQQLQDLFDVAMFDPQATPEERAAAYEDLVSTLWEEYGIDFEDIFDWEDYRDWYDSQ